MRPGELVTGRPLPAALYTASGRLLAHAGTVLSEEMAAVLAEASAAGAASLRFDTRAEPQGVGLRGGRELAAGDEDDRALAAGEPERADRREWDRRLLRMRAELRRSAAALVQVARARWSQMPLSAETGVDPVVPRTGEDRLGDVPSEVEASLRSMRTDGVSALRGVIGTLIDGGHVDGRILSDIADELIDALVRRPSLYSIPAIGLPRPADSLPEHGYTTGALAIGAAARLGWSRAHVRAVGMAGFLCDAGMALVPYPVRNAGRPLTEIEVNAVRRHTEYTVALMRGVRGLPEAAVLGAYQHHERCDGSGYPLGERAARMHDYARVLAVATTLAAMSAPRAHRPALTIHAALSELTHRARAGVVDKAAVKAMVDVLGLYPAGSFVRLSTGHVAVVGASALPGAAARPVVHVVQPEGAPGGRFGRAIDLARIEPKRLRVVEAVGAPDGV